MIKLIVTDMDGTFLNEDKNFSDEFWDIYEELKRKNIRFAVASGRQYYNLENIFSKISNEIIFIAENGGYIMKSGEEIYSNVLSKKDIFEVVESGRKLKNSNIVLCGKKSAYIENDDIEFVIEARKYYDKLELVSDLLEVNDEIIKIAFCNLTGVEEIYRYFSKLKGLKVVVSGYIWLDISNLDVNKGKALKFIQERYNIKREEILAFGDYLNDIELLMESEHSYAMENAHKDLKQIARYIAPSNIDNGVLQIIKKYIY